MEARETGIDKIDGKCLGLSLLKVTQDVRARPEQGLLCSPSRSPALGNNTDLKADRLGYNSGSIQSRCDLGQIS